MYSPCFSVGVYSNEHLKTVKNGRIVLCSCHFILPGKMTVRKLYANKMKTNNWKYTARTGCGKEMGRVREWNERNIRTEYLTHRSCNCERISSIHWSKYLVYIGASTYTKCYLEIESINIIKCTIVILQFKPDNWLYGKTAAMDALMPLTVALTRKNFWCEHRLAHGPNKILIISSGFA